MVWDPKDAPDDTEECQIKNDPRSCERNLCNCVRSLEKKDSGLKQEILKRAKVKGFSRSMVRIVPCGFRGVLLIVSIARSHSDELY